MPLICEGCPLEEERNAIPLKLRRDKPYTIVTKAPSLYDATHDNVMPASYGSVLTKALTAAGFRLNKEFNIIPVVRCAYDKDTFTTKQKTLIAKTCRANMKDTLLALQSGVVIPLGAGPNNAVAGHKVQITKARGVPVYNDEFKTIVLPILDPAIVKIRVDNAPLFASDVQSFVRLVESDLSLDNGDVLFGDYTYIDDIGFIVDADPELLCIDCETEGFNYNNPDTKLLTIQFCYEEGVAYTLSWDHPDSVLSDKKKAKLVSDLRKLKDRGVEFTGHNCLTGDVEFLTQEGWVRMDKYKGDDVMQWDAATQELSFTQPLDVIKKKHRGEILSWEGQMLSTGGMTPDHRLYLSKPSDRRHYVDMKADSVTSPNSKYLPLSGEYKALDNGLLTPDQARLLEAIRADGSIECVPNAVRFNLKKARKIERLYALLKTLGVKYRTSTQGDGTTKVRLITDKNILDILEVLHKGKEYGQWIMWLSMEARQALLEEARHWDATDLKANNRSYLFFTAKDEEAKWFQILAHITGWRFTYNKKANGNRINDGSTLYLNIGTVAPISDAKLHVPATVTDYNGYVYCFTMPTGAFMIRHNGRVSITGNCKFDKLWVNAEIKVDLPISHDTLLLYSLINENSFDKSLSTLTKMYIPSLAGYDDAFNLEVDKSKMIEYPLDDKWLNYASCDADACFQVTHALLDILEKDPELLNYYQRVTIPGINAFAEMEKDGINVDVDKLHEFRGMLSVKVYDMKVSLLNRVPRSIRRAHMAKGLSFSRGDFVRDILFNHKDGFKFKPQVFTDTTKFLPDKSMRLASTSTKKHLPYFLPNQFVADLIEYIKLERMLGTNVINYERKFIHDDGKLWPTHFLSTAVTGRVAAKNPNVMNAPSRGELAKPYKEIFRAPEGMAVVAADLSQAELRVIAHEAREPTMIEIYNSGGDIHARTAAEVMQLSIDEFYAMAPEVIAEKRFGAKGVNFGFVYGLMARSYVSYAKTQYGIDVTFKESEQIRDRYFRTYGGLIPWHTKREKEVRNHGQVRSLFGRLRHLPQIESDDFMTQLEAVRQAINSGIQGVGSDLGVISLSRILSEVDKNILYPRNFIHDAIYSYSPLQYVAWGAIALKYYMESNPIYEMFGFDFLVPIVAEPEIGTSQGTLVEIATPYLELEDISVSDLSYLDPHLEALEKKGLIVPDQMVPPNCGRKFTPRRRR